jgi:deoxyribose-phosphate aldolase
MTDPRLVEAVVRAVLAQLSVAEAPCACHSAAAGCCPDRMGRLLGHGAERFGLQAAADLYPREIARLIDHTLLKPEATRDHIVTLCEEARTHAFASVCVNPAWVPLCADLLRGSETKVCNVVGFPLGATLPDVKAFEAGRCVAEAPADRHGDRRGRAEVRRLTRVERDIEGVVAASHRGGAIVKVIIEAALLTDDER